MAERITKDMSQRQKLELYKSIYAGYGLRFDIEQEMEIEDKSVPVADDIEGCPWKR